MGSQESIPQKQPQKDKRQQSGKKQLSKINQVELTIKNSQVSNSRFVDSRYTIADAILKHSLQSKTDTNVSRLVQSRMNSLPLSEAKVTKLANLGVIGEEQQSYDPYLRAKFVGQKLDGKPHGFGKLYFENNDYLEGTFINGRCEGEGRIIKADGSYYEGQIINNQADGHGKFYGVDGYKYEGQWKNNMPNGTGQALYKDGSRYVGQFLNNKRNGKGMYITKGSTFQGDFKEDKIDGICTFVSENGQRYEGEWKKGMKQGHGIYHWPDGKRYEGQYKFDHRHGMGTMHYSQNQKYIGRWQNGHKNGEGVYETENQRMNGIWIKGNLVQILK